MKVRWRCRICLIVLSALLFASVFLHMQLISNNQPSLYGPNLLVKSFTNESIISYQGWWMSHARWGVASSCESNQDKCPHAYTAQCKMDGIKSLYQFNALSSETLIAGFTFSTFYSTHYMSIEQITEDSFVGVLILVKLQDFKVVQKRLPLPALNTDGELTDIIDLGEVRGVSVASVTVCLCCVGVEGLAKFWNVKLRPVAPSVGRLDRRDQYVVQCPKSLLLARQPDHIYSEEVILTPSGVLSSLVTLVIQMSIDRIDMLSLNAAVWNGPMSIVIYFPAKSTKDTEHAWKRKYVEKKLNQFRLHPYTHLTVVYARSVLDAYPINALRNLAMKHVHTDYMLVLDGDFIVSLNFEASFQPAVAQTTSLLLPGDHVIYVVPVFELIADKWNSDQYISPFFTKQELISHITQDDTDIFPFRSAASPLAHYSTNYSHWYTASVPYLVTDYRDKYEPYLVLKKTDGLPLFNEWFEDYGMNKVTHVMELWAAGYQFVVLPDNWAIHVPHVETKYAKTFLLDLDKRVKNRILRFEFITYLMAEYKLDECGAHRDEIGVI